MGIQESSAVWIDVVHTPHITDLSWQDLGRHLQPNTNIVFPQSNVQVFIITSTTENNEKPHTKSGPIITNKTVKTKTGFSEELGFGNCP